MCDAQVKNQGNRPRSVSQVGGTPLTPALSRLLCLYFVGCAKQVSKLLNCPVMGLLGSRMGGTGAHMFRKSIKMKLLATTSRERQSRNSGDLRTHS
jgi:hypothetical protein